MSDPNVELKRFTNSSNSSGFAANSPPAAWQNPPPTVDFDKLNPTYQGISERSDSLDPTVNERMYDFVPGGNQEKEIEKVPNPPPGRRTTTNTIYEPSAGTLHPQTLSRGYSNGEVEHEAEYDEEESSSHCVRTCLLSLFVIVSLFLAVVAVVLVLLLWFGVIDPTVCPTAAPIGATSESSATDSPSCSCDNLDLQPMIDRINEEAANLTAQIEKLSNEVGEYFDQNANLSSTTDTLDVAIGTVNSSCLNSLNDVTDQLGSIGGLNFNAQLLNVGVFNSCVYEYVDECTMPNEYNDCQTEFANTTVPGYSNIDLACHVGVSNAMGALQFAPITNLRFNTTGIDAQATPNEVLDQSMVRCECSLVAIDSNNPTRSETFHCKMYRSRCLTTEDFSTTIMT